MSKINVLGCLHCNHEWPSRLGRKPKVCPNCKSYNWDKLPKITRYQTRDEWDIQIALKRGKFKESDFDERYSVFFNNYLGKSPSFFKKRYETFKQQFKALLK